MKSYRFSSFSHQGRYKHYGITFGAFLDPRPSINKEGHTYSGLPEGILGPGHGDLVDILRQLDLGVTIDIHQLVDTAQSRLANKKRVFSTLTNKMRVLGVLTNERRVLTVLTNERPVLPAADM